MYPTFFTLLVLLAFMVFRDRAIQVAVVLCLFGATAALELPALGGATIPPVVLFIPFLAWSAVRQKGVRSCVSALAYPGAGFWLVVTASIGVMSAVILPRLLAGQVLIQTLDRTALFGIDGRLMPLAPVSTNLTQSAYVVGSVCVFAAGTALLLNKDGLTRFRSAVLLLTLLNIVAAFYNLAELYLGAPRLLIFLRTAGLAIFDGGEVGGLLRLTGTFSETAAFSGFTLPLFAFSATLWRLGIDSAKTGALALCSLALLLISTSGTAYVGLAVYLSAAFMIFCISLLLGRQVRRTGALLTLIGAIVAMICILILTQPALVEAVLRFFDTAVLGKPGSESGRDRGAMNVQAWSNFLDTFGIGVGLGSTRASSFPLVVLSNLGFLGAMAFLAFLGRALFGDRQLVLSDSAATVAASRQAILASLICASIAATVFDLGALFYLFAAAAATAASRASSRSAVPLHA